jgi:hypothetical protein
MRTRIQLLTVLLVYVGILAAQSKFDAPQGPRPIVMVGSSWQFLASARPSIIVYDNGMVISAQSADDHSLYYTQKQLSVEDFEKAKDTLAKLVKPSDKSRVFPGLGCFDCPTTTIYVRLKDTSIHVQVRGLEIASAEEKTAGVQNLEEEPLIPRLRRLRIYLNSLASSSNTPWEPRFFKVIFVASWFGGSNPPALERSNSKPRGPSWPKEWPGLTDQNTERDMDFYTFYLPGSELTKLKSVVGPPNRSVAMEIDGKQGTLRYRYVFPNESDFGRNGEDDRP